MEISPERWNEDIGSNIHNVEAMLVQMVGRQSSNGKGAKSTILQHGHAQPVNVPNNGVYGAMLSTGRDQTSGAASRLRAEFLTSLDGLNAQMEQLTTLQAHLVTAVEQHQAAAKSASSALQAVQSRVDHSLPVRSNDVVRVRNSIQATT
ncbi:unnamed protein product [Penicillium bialowiezense]